MSSRADVSSLPLTTAAFGFDSNPQAAEPAAPPDTVIDILQLQRSQRVSSEIGPVRISTEIRPARASTEMRSPFDAERQRRASFQSEMELQPPMARGAQIGAMQPSTERTPATRAAANAANAMQALNQPTALVRNVRSSQGVSIIRSSAEIRHAQAVQIRAAARASNGRRTSRDQRSDCSNQTDSFTEGSDNGNLSMEQLQNAEHNGGLRSAARAEAFATGDTLSLRTSSRAELEILRRKLQTQGLGRNRAHSSPAALDEVTIPPASDMSARRPSFPIEIVIRNEVPMPERSQLSRSSTSSSSDRSERPAEKQTRWFSMGMEALKTSVTVAGTIMSIYATYRSSLNATDISDNATKITDIHQILNGTAPSPM